MRRFVAILPILGLAYMLRQGANESRESVAALGERLEKLRAAEERAWSTAIPRERPAVPWGLFDSRGTSKLVRCFEAGAALNQVAEDLENRVISETVARRRLRDLEPFLLDADRTPGLSELDTRARLHELTHPPRDLAAVRLVNATKPQSLGERLPLRLWTLGLEYAADEISEARDNLEHVARVCGISLVGGFDVIASGRMGSELFSGQRHSAGAAGVYFPADQYCVVDSTSKSRYRREVLKHELMHALYDRLERAETTSVFVSEGLAEYLRHCRPGDDGLQIPPARLAAELESLHRMIERLEARGVPIDRLDPSRLLKLSRQDFYALAEFSYLVAMASIAHIGGQVVEESLARDRPDILRNAIAGIRWHELRTFLRDYETRAGPREPLIVGDLIPEDGKDVAWTRTNAAQRAAFGALGVEVPADVRLSDSLLDTRAPGDAANRPVLTIVETPFAADD